MTPLARRMGGFWGLGFGVVDPFGYDPTALVGFASPLSGQHRIDEGFPFTVGADIVLSHPVAHDVSVHWSTANFGVVPGFITFYPAIDYVAASGIATFAPGQTTAHISTVANSSSSGDPNVSISYVGFELSDPRGAIFNPTANPPETNGSRTIYLLGS